MSDLSPWLDRIHCMDALELCKQLPSESVHCVVTSPPYYGLRQYLPDGHQDKDKEIGLEGSMADYIASLTAIFREARRVLRPDGNFFLNLGDSYAGSGKGPTGHNGIGNQVRRQGFNGSAQEAELPSKSLMGIPWRVAFALQDDGWLLRRDIIWHKCLSGGAYIYTRTQKGDMPMMLRDAARLNPATVQLWNGQRWTRAVSWERLPRKGTELELVLRSGERISCTPEHRFPTQRGILEAVDLRCGDVLEATQLPEPDSTYAPPAVTDDAAWFVGMYLAEGSMSGDTIQIAGHARETQRLERLKRIAVYYGGSLTYTAKGNSLNIRMHGRLLIALIEQYISGHTAHNKGLKVCCWSHGNDWLRNLLDGYLAGDGHWDSKNNRWRLSFTRNYYLERDLRTLAARLGLKVTIKLSVASMGDRKFPAFRGELRMSTSTHFNTKSMTEIIDIRKARCREVYDVAVADDPHLFALASGVLTHNSNPMPESVTDRCANAHEYIFHFVKGPHYWYDQDAVRTASVDPAGKSRGGSLSRNGNDPLIAQNAHRGQEAKSNGSANLRSVWSLATEPFSESHFATFPSELPRRCIKAGCPARVCAACGIPYEAIKQASGTSHHGGKRKRADAAGAEVSPSSVFRTGVIQHHEITGWEPACNCDAEVGRGIVLDMFGGAATTGLVARELGRHFILGELNPDYVAMATRRLADADPYSDSVVAEGVVQRSLFSDGG